MKREFNIQLLKADRTDFSDEVVTMLSALELMGWSLQILNNNMVEVLDQGRAEKTFFHSSKRHVNEAARLLHAAKAHLSAAFDESVVKACRGKGDNWDYLQTFANEIGRIVASFIARYDRSDDAATKMLMTLRNYAPSGESGYKVDELADNIFFVR